jgi:hypothetical protein
VVWPLALESLRRPQVFIMNITQPRVAQKTLILVVPNWPTPRERYGTQLLRGKMNRVRTGVDGRISRVRLQAMPQLAPGK